MRAVACVGPCPTRTRLKAQISNLTRPQDRESSSCYDCSPPVLEQRRRRIDIPRGSSARQLGRNRQGNPDLPASFFLPPSAAILASIVRRCVVSTAGRRPVIARSLVLVPPATAFFTAMRGQSLATTIPRRCVRLSRGTRVSPGTLTADGTAGHTGRGTGSEPSNEGSEDNHIPPDQVDEPERHDESDGG